MTFWHWLILGLTVLLSDLFANTLVLFWIGLGALVVSFLMWLMPEMPWQAQWLIFAALSLAVTVFWWKFQRSKDQKDDSNNPLNNKMNNYIGKQFRLETTIESRGRAKIGDTTWAISSSVPISANTLVEVVAVDGIVLKVQPLISE